MVVAKFLNDIRESSGLSQSEFLERLEMSQSSWSRLNRGLSFLTLEELRIACKLLNVDASNIIKSAEIAIEKLKNQENIEVLSAKKAIDNKTVATTIVAAAALAFLLARISK